MKRGPVVHENFLSFLDSLDAPSEQGPAPEDPVFEENDLTWAEAGEILKSQLASRQVDLVAREMKERDEGYYTIASAGHEGNAVFSDVLRTTDPALVHYRSGGFMLQRMFRDRDRRPLYEILLSLAASAKDPVAGGRHKVWGDPNTFIPPQTSTIASHLPRAIGMAFALERMKRLNLDPPFPPDSVMVCSFGDASVNHSVFQGALNAALWTVHQNLPFPLLLICEDNEWGISVPTPEGWIEQSMKSRHELGYYQCDGDDFTDLYRTTTEAVRHCRKRRSPVFLHMKTVRLLGHAGSDIELEYRELKDVQETESKDPLKSFAKFFVDAGYLSPSEVRDMYEDAGKDLRERAGEAAEAPKLETAREVMEPLASFSPGDIKREVQNTVPDEKRLDYFDTTADLPEHEERGRHMAELLNRGLTDLMLKYNEMTVFGEDVAEKGGVYYVTRDLKEKFGPARVFNTLLDETTILGLSLGMATTDMLPVPEIQYLAYVFNAYDQLRGEALSQSFFSRGQFKNGMVVRIQSFAYQEGFGGHFHNDNGIAALREIPGVAIAAPSRGDDAVRMLRTATAMARVDGRVVLFLEPIALYHKTHLYEEDDGEWAFSYPSPGEHLLPGNHRIYTEGTGGPDLLIVTFANGVWMSRRAARSMHDNHGITTRILDLHWLKPLNTDIVEQKAREIGRVLIMDECRETGGPSEELMCHLRERDTDATVRRVTAEDTYVPLGPATDAVLPDEEDIRTEALELLSTEV